MPRATGPNSSNMVATAKPMPAGSTGHLAKADPLLRVAGEGDRQPAMPHSARFRTAYLLAAKTTAPPPGQLDWGAAEWVRNAWTVLRKAMPGLPECGGLPPRPSRRTRASTTVTSGQDIGPPLTLNGPATGNGVPPIAGIWP